MGFTDEELFHVAKTELPETEQRMADRQCDRLRIQFLRKWIMDSNLDLYTTDAERDWGYIARREIRALEYNAFFKSFAICTAFGLLTCWARRGPPHFSALLPLPFLYYGSSTVGLVNENRRIFGLVNIGTEYALGAERNRVLEECNRVSRRADF